MSFKAKNVCRNYTSAGSVIVSAFITSIGEILIDFLPIEVGGTTTGFTMHPGGGPFNVAVGIARLGQPVAFASKISADFFGRYLRAYATSQQIDTRFLATDDRALSTLAFVDREGGEPSFTFYGNETADTRLTADDLPDTFFDETAILHFGGISLLRGTTPDAILHAAERLHGKALLSFDPNWRPALVRDEEAYRDLLRRLFALADIVKLSVADIACLAPNQPVERVGADLLAAGAALVVVTRGSQGVLALRSSATGEPQRWEVPSFSVRVMDTVGAGDAYSAGLLAGLAERGVDSRAALLALPPEKMRAILHFAAATAALTCTRAGANPPHRAEVDLFLAGQA